MAETLGGVAALLSRRQRHTHGAGVGVSGPLPKSVFPPAPTMLELFCSRFRSRAHRDFVRDVTWSPLNHSLLTTVGWDHRVIHHVVLTEPPPAPGPNSVAE